MNLREELAERMARPQRHRLLQGFPAVPAMERAGPPGRFERLRRFYDVMGTERRIDGSLVDHEFDLVRKHRDEFGAQTPRPAGLVCDTDEGKAVLARGDKSEPAWLSVDTSRALIVGVLPHTQCIPRREGCGFCTFPHDAANRATREEMVGRVCSNIAFVTSHEALEARPVEAIYLGGGTANLSSTEEITAIVRALGEKLRIGEAELTLEGTAHLFDRLLSSHLKNLLRLPVGQRRVSIGVQSFEESYLRMMGREHFGDAALVKRLVKRCKSLGITTSADLLYNLPEQSLEQMLRDVDTAVSIGLEQVCVYNLVLYEGLGTGWSKEREFLESVPTNERACANWLRVRARLLEHGYVQTTLTNFERADAAGGPERFRYETASFSVERVDGIGFGPLAISTVVNAKEKRGLKLLRRKSLGSAPWGGEDLMYRYDDAGLRSLFVTRGLAKTRVEAEAYRAMFGSELADDAREGVEVLREAGLVQSDERGLALTPVGMFYADSVVSLLAASARREGEGAGLRTRDLLREKFVPDVYGGMG